MQTRLNLEKRIVLLTVVGSNLYGTNIEDSDVDYRGICIADKKYYLGLKSEPFYLQEKNQSFTESPCIYDLVTNTDTKILELRKMIELLIGNNPNCLDLLHSPSYVVLNDAVKPLIEHRDKFLCKRARYSYGQYARDQIALCNTHRGWILELKKNPSFFLQQPNPIDYGLDENLLRKDNNMFLELLYTLLLDAKTFHLERHPQLEELFSTVDFKGLLVRNYFPNDVEEIVKVITRSNDAYMDYLKRIRSYLNDLNKYKQFKSWQAHRNKKRAELEAKCGFDSKNIAHAIRLYSMANEIVTSGKVIVDRRLAGDADYIRTIRLGDVSYDEVLTYISELETKLEEAFKTTNLPESPDLNFINNMLVDILERYIF